jgi:hypothetical protein
VHTSNQGYLASFPHPGTLRQTGSQRDLRWADRPRAPATAWDPATLRRQNPGWRAPHLPDVDQPGMSAFEPLRVLPDGCTAVWVGDPPHTSCQIRCAVKPQRQHASVPVFWRLGGGLPQSAHRPPQVTPGGSCAARVPANGWLLYHPTVDGQVGVGRRPARIDITPSTHRNGRRGWTFLCT